MKTCKCIMITHKCLMFIVLSITLCLITSLELKLSICFGNSPNFCQSIPCPSLPYITLRPCFSLTLPTSGMGI